MKLIADIENERRGYLFRRVDFVQPTVIYDEPKFTEIMDELEEELRKEKPEKEKKKIGFFSGGINLLKKLIFNENEQMEKELLSKEEKPLFLE